ncbi:hypothetical protein JIN84_03675 [Luteolibacter yonseiensis]|uniref:Lipoprotein n=1 Tax=Luteolibacter yonseiensis TaxID=1144680 RepID=A0A934R1D6_9BACT|nr:hypothetical protein [Luteolibacter yonseiensis]MBK1814697.1 hypothetical protein [Luteolibacter yonseiensis]
MKKLIPVALMALVLASCQTSIPTNLTGVRTVGIANGMGGKLTRNKVGTTVFNNAYESTEVPSITSKVSETAARNLKSRFSTVKILPVQATAAKQGFLATNQNINEEAFKVAAINAAKQQNLDAVWVLYPRKYAPYQSRGAALSGYEHRQDGMLGFSNESAACIAYSELLNVETGQVIAAPSTSFNMAPTLLISSRGLPSRKWQKRLSDYDAASRADIINAATEAGRDRVVFLLNASNITTSAAR